MPNRYQHNKAFRKALKQLNPTQRKAVEEIDGPVMVVAGPGTGKTQVLAARIGSILLHTDTNPYELLCLTYSDAGVIAMQQRLLEWIGPEAHRVPIFTFHSFANKVIRENPLTFGGIDMEVIDELERSEVIRKMLDDLSPDNPLVVRSFTHHFYEKHLANLFKLIKQENWKVKDLLRDIDAHVASLAGNKDYISSRGKTKGQYKSAYYEEINRMKRLRAGVQLFPKYTRALRKIGRYDFEDMIRWVVTAFEKKEYLLRKYQEQFLYFLVDEYQDTNGVQNQLLQLLISYWHNPNVFVVGDDDQSVFEFQGARIKNIADFYERYKDTIQLFVLEDNYRSKKEILDVAGQLISYNQIRLIHQEGIHASKNLKAQSTTLADLGQPVEIITLDNYVQELAAILDTVQKYQNQGVPLSEMAIIYRKHKVANNIIKLLEINGLSYELKKSANLLDEALSRQLLTIFKYIAKEKEHPLSGENLVFELLSIPAFDLSARDIVRLNFHRVTSKLSWWEMLHDDVLLDSFDLAQADKIKNTRAILDELMVATDRLPLTEWVEKAINQSGFLAYALNHPDKQWNLEVLFSFRKFIKDQVLKNQELTLPEVIRYFQRLHDNKIPIPVMKIRGRSEGIKLLTAHSAKGLEFRLVIMPDCTSDWEKKFSGNTHFKIPENITLSGSDNDMEAERRLFYVSMTRAKEKLVILYPLKNEKGKGNKPSQFISELNLNAKNWEAPTDQINQIEAGVLQFHQAPLVKLEKDLVRSQLEQFALSISALNSFLKCPVSFYYNYILQIPSEPSAPFLYGNAIHGALRKMVEQMRLSKTKTYPSVDTVIDFFKQEMKRVRGQFAPNEYETRLVRGQEALRDYYESHYDDWILDTLAEYSVTHTEIDGVPVRGSIDRIDFVDAQTAHVVDYKTGTPKPVTAPTDKKPLGSDYWRQLIFYALLFEFQRADSRRVASGTISFIERSKTNKHIDKSFTINPEDKRLLRETIKETWTKIQNSEFYEGCGDAKCQWCEFQRTQEAPASFRDVDILGLDD
ncbi:MAG TPA: ATP-dependent helicase [Saprospiraceae bacterium]|nr:ATP-dependent helicase [Saprospiraceae bacterium]